MFMSFSQTHAWILFSVVIVYEDWTLGSSSVRGVEPLHMGLVPLKGKAWSVFTMWCIARSLCLQTKKKHGGGGSLLGTESAGSLAMHFPDFRNMRNQFPYLCWLICVLEPEWTKKCSSLYSAVSLLIDFHMARTYSSSGFCDLWVLFSRTILSALVLHKVKVRKKRLI